MKNNTRLPSAAELLHELKHNPELRREYKETGELDRGLAMLRNWQSARLAQTYSDLLKDPRYAEASKFFLSDIYAPRDFAQRDHDAERIHAYLSRLLPPYMYSNLTYAIAVNQLSYKLDNELLQVLVNELGVNDSITPEQYAEGYRKCDNYNERVEQIDIVVKLIGEIGAGARLPLVGLALKLVHGPALAAGWDEVYDFLERGYRAFKPMNNVKRYASIIETREKKILDQIYAGIIDPFLV